MANEVVRKFMLRNGFDPEILQENLDNVHVLRRPRNLNWIIINNQTFYKPKERKEISVADIYGYQDAKDYYLLESMDKIFGGKRDERHRESVEILNYTSDEILKKLSSSLESEPMQAEEVEKNKYIISENDVQRFTILRAHYLIEYEKCKNSPEKLQQLKEKYTIPVMCSTMDYLKTYSVFILKKCGLKETIEMDYSDGSQNIDLLIFKKADGTKRLVDDNLLLEFTRKAIIDNHRVIDIIKSKAFLSPSFNDYVTQCFPELLVEEPKEEIKNGISKK